MSSDAANSETTRIDVEYPRKADLRKDVSRPLPNIPPGTIDPASMTGGAPNIQAKAALDAFNAALASKNVEELANCFYTEQSYWRDIVALTSHLRTFTTPRVVAAALLKMIALRNIVDKAELAGDAHFAIMSPVMMFIDCGISFRISSPALENAGKMILLPVKAGGVEGSVCWKIWILSTWVENLVNQPEDETLLLAPSSQLYDAETIATDVLIVGAGSSGIMTAARLKALGVESVVLDRNAQVGDNWANRYDSLRFHVPTSNCEMPYAYFKKELQSPHGLTKDEVADHLQQYAKNFHLNIISLAIVQSTVYSPSKKKWTVTVKSVDGSWIKTITSKHFVQATGLGSGKPYLPPMKYKHLYKGQSIHSAQYRNTQVLSEQGVKDCYKAGLQTTMVVRSPTYIFPYDYVIDPHSLGAYDLMPLNVADKLLNTFPSSLDGQFSHALFAHLASKEPDRYLALSQAGFPVLDSRDPSVNIQHHLLERGGGHYLDVGGTDLIAEGKVAVRAHVEPVGYTDTGLRLSDGSVLDADAVIWCTGFADIDARMTAMELLGAEEASIREGDLGPADIVMRLDASWGVDAEGEVRGVWKRHLRMDNYWVMGGNMQQQRWWSRPMAQQIKLALDGSLPPAYRDIPVPT
ncbi:MAG: hypothetical protein Q9227_001109 [Pyrenula ochraceoflavens]